MENGSVFMWGDPYKGQLGQYETNQNWDHKEDRLFSTPNKIYEN